ncbi:replication protein A 70 kDa DNA-binding subunit B-like [Coffea eugenioides]|uniref:replication protein A 70 kDa DNA-binding subunit B-like n=1 Tax=Coffea eugenioides TaxID=49369 RepID=UPI000F6117E3|nr:replication protein A 70 kDa DNA-binding subunit B-like [Coffea eugenioides]
MATILPINDVEVGMEKWTAKVTVQEKQQVTSSRSTPTKKQKFIFIDSEGSKVEGIVFNADIPIMSSRIEVYKKYLISNAQVKKIPDDFKTTEIAKQWIITSRTIIEEIVDEEDVIAANFTYTKFKDLAQYMDRKDISVDIMGIVIAALDEKIVTKNSKESRVRKLVIVNEELQTLMLSMWNAFIDTEGSKIISEIQNYPVLIGRRLKVQNYNGVALSTWFDSAILVNPPIQEARELKNWASRNAKCLADIIEKRTYNRYNPDISFQADQKTTDIANIDSKQKNIWVNASFSFEHIFQKFWYIGCEKCFRSTSADYGVLCKFDVDLSDDTGTVTATLFGDLAEKLLTFTAKEAMDHYYQNMPLPLEILHEELKATKSLAHIRPVHTLLADAKQRFTMVYYKEASHEQVSITKSNEQAFTCPSSGETSSSKAKACLLKKFDESDETSQLSSAPLQTSPRKKARQA